MNFKIPPNMAGRKTKLTPERQEKILRCVRAGMSYKDAAQSVGITPETLCRWIARGKVESGLFHEFYESIRKALVHFELVHLENIERSALRESKIIQQTVKYKGGEILNGQLKDGKVKYATIMSKFSPPKAEASMWLLARSFPERWGPQAKGEAHEGKAPDRQATVILYKLDKNGRVCDLVLLCIVKTAPPTKSRTYAPLEFRAEDGETPPLCSTLLSSSSHLASVSFG